MLVQVQMMCNVAHLHWQEHNSNGGEPVRDAAAVTSTLSQALDYCGTAERIFRGEAWGNPAALYMDVLEAAQCLTARGCDVGSIAGQARQEVKRLASSGPKSFATAEPVSCWSDAIQERFAAMPV